MNRLRQRLLSALAALTGGLLLAMLLASCGGGGDQDSTEIAAPAGDSTPTVESVLALESFHYVATLTVREKQRNEPQEKVVISTEGDFQQPNRHSFTYTTSVGGDSLKRSAVIIGSDAWMRQDGGPWREVTIADAEFVDLVTTAFSSIKPDFLGGPEYEAVLESVRRLGGTEDVANDVPSYRYTVFPEGEAFFLALLTNQELASSIEDPDWELWLAQDGAWPVRLLARATVTGETALSEQFDLQAPNAWELRIDISRPNDPALVVAPPQNDE